MRGKEAKRLRRASLEIGRSRAAYRRLKRARQTGQHPKPLVVRVRKPKEAIKPTWPATPNQRAQSRPVILLQPLRLLKAKLIETSSSWTQRDESEVTRTGWLPKHDIDSMVRRIVG